MGGRFAIVIGVAAAGVMALGAQTALAGESVHSTPPDLQLSGKKKQELGNAVKVKASCGDEACQADGGGDLHAADGHRGYWQKSKWFLKPWLKKANADLGPGETTTLELPLGNKQRKVAGKVLDEGKNVQAKVTVEATDAAGNMALAKRTITFVK
jgi:hypothetical protein